VQNMVAKTIERYGRLDVLFNNAGVEQGVELIEMSEQEWHAFEAVAGRTLREMGYETMESN